jgi:hypothetical protein
MLAKSRQKLQLPTVENVLDSRQNQEVAGKNGVVGLRRDTIRLWCVHCTEYQSEVPVIIIKV